MNLTTLENVKSWLTVGTTTDDALLARLITQMSGLIYAYLQRSSVIQTDYTDTKNGSGNNRIQLENWPVLSVSSLNINGAAITAAPNISTGFQAGYVLTAWSGRPPGRAQLVELRGYNFPQGTGNVTTSYTAGYVVQAEAQSIPNDNKYGVLPYQPYGSWAADSGVTFADGTALTAVASSPIAGQYVAPIYGRTTGYQFAAADAGKAILMSYSYIPAPVEQACIEMCSERYRYRGRIGERSKSIGGAESVSYDLSGMSDAVMTMLQPYVDYTQDFSV